ncbi:hypothetical protein D9M72_658140 [compost metagenome]
MVAGGIGEQVDAVLGDFQPVGAAEVQPLGGEHLLGAAEYGGHGILLRRAAS